MNLATARFHFKALFDAMTIQEWLDFEGGIYRDQYARAYTASLMSLFVHTYNVCVHMYIIVDPLLSSEISRVGLLTLGACARGLR